MRRSLAFFAMTVSFASSVLAQTPTTPDVVVSMKPVHALVLQVMEGVAKPDLLVDGAQSPHTYAMKPSDARALNRAGVFFRVSPSVESFTVRAVKGLPKSVRVVTLEEAPGVKRLPRRTDPNFRKISAGGKGHSHGHGHSHGQHHDHAKSDMDGHVWLDPENAKAMTRHIAAVLAEVYAAHATTFKTNADKAIARLEKLTSDIDADLKGAAGKPYVVFHDGYQYLEARYGLTPVGAIVGVPDTPPSGKRLADLRAQVGQLKIACVFSEPTFETRVVQSIIEGSPARSANLDPEATRIPAGPDAYETLMRSMAREIRGCLTPSS